MNTRCKPGDLAIVVYDIPECTANIGRVVEVRGPLECSRHYKLWCWLIKPVRDPGWRVDRRGRICTEQVTWTTRIEHPDAWLLPIRPEDLESIAECTQVDLDRFLARLKTDTGALKQPVSTSAEA